MSSVKKLVRDSLDDEDVSDDVDDEVFIRDGRTFKLDDDRGLKRPLMVPRRKFKSSSSYFSYGESSTLKKLRVPFCYTLLCVIILCCLIALALILINMNTTYMLNKLMHPSSDSSSNSDNSYKPCTDYEVEELWHYTLPKIKSETPVRSVDVNGDGIEDVIIGYGTGADQADLPLYTCEMYFGQSGPCAGGVLALDGKTGALLWQEWLKRSVLKLDCSYDVTQDDVNDCLVSGESGLLCIINGKIGRVTWCLPHNELAWSTGGLGLDFYAGEFIPDVNEDGVVDVISTHTNGSSATMIGSHVIILSGATGEVLHHLTSPVPGEMMLSSPHILVRPDGESVVVFCTVRNNAPTSIYVVSLSSLVNGDSNLVKSIYSDIEGLTASPILIDMNDDQTEDIVVNSKSKLLVFNGLNYSLILNISYPFDDSYEHDIPFLPVPGYFNNDTIPDFFVTYSVGSTEFLYYSVSTVLDGKTGKSLLSAPIIRSNIADVSGITLSSPGYGNDAFVYWMSSCVNFETNQDDYKLSGRSYEVDICNARFNTSTEIKLMLLSQHVPSPGIVLYSSSTNFETEINGTANILEQVKEYINLHPEVKEKIEEYQVNRLGSSPAKCNNAELEALQPPVYYMPNAYDPEMIPDPVPRAYPRDRYPGDNLNPPEYQNIGPDFPAPDEETRERDERDDETNTSEDIAKVNENTDSSGSDQDVLDKTSDNAKVDKESGSKEEMPREKRSSNKIMPRRKRKIAGNVYEYTDKYENEGDDKFFGNDMEEETSRTYGNENIHDQTQTTEKNNNFSAREESFYENPKELYGKLDKEDQMENEKYSLKENHKNLHERGYEMNGSMGEVDDNHAGEVFDEYADEMEYRKQIANRENNDVDENHGGESLDDYDEDEPKLEMKIRHAQKYKNVERDEPKRRENKLVGNEIDRDYANDEAYKDQKDLDTNRRTEENKRSRQKGYDYKEDEDSDDEDEDDNEEEEENEKENLKETEQDDIEEDDEDSNNDNEDDEDDEEDEDDEDEDDDTDDEMEDEEIVETSTKSKDEQSRMKNTNSQSGQEKNERLLVRNKRYFPQSSSSLSRHSNFPSKTRHKYFHGPNHKKKVSMQEKWWKYIMLTNSEDWQMKKKNIQREENRLKEEKRKLEERQGSVDGSVHLENRTRELEKRSRELKEEEENLMKNIPSKKMINLDEQFLNYVKKSLGLKNNDSSISNYDVDDVEQLWDDFIEINVLNHRGYNDDYEFDAIVKDDSKNKRTEIQNSIDSKNNIKYPEHSKQMVSYNLHATNKDNHHPINGLHEKLTSANHNSKPDNIVSHIVDENDLQQKFNHFSTLDQLKLINRINKNNKTKQNRIIKNNLDIAGSSGNNDQTMGSAKKLTENMTNDIKNFKVILKNGENFKYNDYYKWKDNSEYVNFDSYYNILKNTDGGDSNDMEGNNYESNKNRIIPNNITTKQTVEVPSKLFSLQKNLTIHCNSYFFKRRLECEDNSKSNTQTVTEDTKNKHSSKKQKSSRKIRKKLHEKTQTNLGIKHIVVNDTKSDTKGRALVIEKMNYKFPYNFGKEKIYSEKDLELIFNNETHAEIKKIMKLNLKKINDSISKIKNGSRNSSAYHHHWSNVNYYKSHKLIRNKSDNNIDDKDYKPDNNHTNEFMKQTNKTAKDIWFNTLHSLKNNKQFLKHLKSTTYKSNRVIGNSRNSDEESNHFNSDVDLSSNNLLNEQNADLITKKIDLQNNIERIQISELKNSKNKTNKLFPYRRRDKNVQDKTNNENRIENLFGLTDNMITIVNHTRNVRPNKTENTVLGLPVGGKYSSHLNWHEKNQYGLPLRNKWESTTEILANSQRHHRLLKVKKRSIEDVNQPEVKRGLIETREDEGIIKNVDESKSINVGITSKDNSYLTNISKYQKRSTVKKDLSETIIASPKNNSNPLRKSPGGAKHAQTSNEVTSDIKETNENMTVNNTFNQDKLDSSNVGNKDFYSQKDRMSTSDNIVKRSIEKYLKILPRASSTPILLNSISNDTNSLDIVFVSFWVPPKVDIKKLTKSQQDCVRLKVLRAKSINCYSAFDDLVIEEEMAKQCINLDENASQEDVRGENIQYNQYYLQGDTQSPFYNPFNLRFGQLSVYRVRIKCKQCSSVFETIQNQGWPSGNGQMSNGVFVKKHAHRG